MSYIFIFLINIYAFRKKILNKIKIYFIIRIMFLLFANIGFYLNS